MQIVHVESRAAEPEETLAALVKARDTAAANVVWANEQSIRAKQALVEHVAARLRAGADATEIRAAMRVAGMAEPALGKLMAVVRDQLPPQGRRSSDLFDA